MGRVRAYLGCSIDGRIAGPGDDLGFLHAEPPPPAATDALVFEAFLAQVGALLMGRRTYDVLAGLGVAWPYGDRPVLVATRRPLVAVAPSVRAVRGDIAAMVASARSEAGALDVYLDGGDLVRQALAAGLLDELVLTMLPLALGAGVSLWDGLAGPRRLTFVAHRACGTMLQVVLRPDAVRGEPPVES